MCQCKSGVGAECGRLKTSKTENGARSATVQAQSKHREMMKRTPTGIEVSKGLSCHHRSANNVQLCQYTGKDGQSRTGINDIKCTDEVIYHMIGTVMMT